ncbi:MAG: creatininase family protein [Dongiaceae bacterium]
MLPRSMRAIRRLSIVLCLGGLALLGFFGTAARAQTPDTVWLEDLTWTELRDQIAAGKTTILVPIGGTEQSGPQMAVGKHDARVRVLSERIARDLGNALVAPVIAYVPEGSTNPPVAHLRWPGTITVSDDVFEKLLESAGRSFKLHGFKDVVFLGDHGGYQKDLTVVANQLNKEWANSPVRAHALLDYYKVTETTYVQALKSRGYTDAEIGTHAGLADTSLLMATNPRMVRTDLLPDSAKYTRTDGVYGNPTRSSAALGQLGVDAIVSQTVTAIRKAVVRP